MPNTSRFGGNEYRDKSSNSLQNDYQTPAYAASIAIVAKAYNTVVKVDQLTGALSLTIDTTVPYVGDKIQFLFAADATNRTVTFSTGFAPSATLAITASKKGSASFTFDGAAWVETGRAITA